MISLFVMEGEDSFVRPKYEGSVEEPATAVGEAEAIVETHYKFHLQDEVIKTTTDNGKNFVKAFMQFGTEVELLPNIPEVAVDTDVEGMEDVALDVQPEAGDEDEVEYISLDAILEESSGLGLNLLMYMKCAAHTVNCVASMDADKALDSTSFKSADRKIMSNAHRLWNLR
ncbi:Hypothetical predicted protein [Octopus vulgaris]|uniref:Uncharacterized protein n=1 Tax=Octopus vulgaris TaxID=6645 RepID=A0AA36B831_OCTVU|nr:Hypothetical predicted protein [Octopus vulgaris]